MVLSIKGICQVDVNEQLALQYYQNGEFDKASQLYKAIYDKNPSTFYYGYYLNCLFAQKDYNAAEKFVSKVASINPENQKYNVELGYVNELKGDTKKAEKIYKKTIKDLPKNREKYIELSNAFQNRQHYDYSLQILEKGKNMFTPPLNIEIADMYLSKGEYNNMISSYLDMIDANQEYLDLVKGKLQLIIAAEGSSKISDALHDELLKRTQNNPSKTIYSELLYWYSLQKHEFDLALIQAKSLDKQFNEGGERVFQLANILISNFQYKLAVDAYQYLLNLGTSNRFFISAEINILNAQFLDITKNSNINKVIIQKLAENYKNVLDKYGENLNTMELMKQLAHIEAFYLHNTDYAKTLLNRILNINNLKPLDNAEIKLELGDVLLFAGEKWSASLLYKQVEKAYTNEPIGYEAKFKAAKFFYYVGQIDWAKTQLDVLKGATSKLIANDAMELSLLISENMDPDSSYTSLSRFAEAELLVLQKKFDEAFLKLDTLENLFPNYLILPNVEYKRAQMYLELADYQKAIEHFQKTVDNFPNSSIADNALIELARLYDNILKDNKKAKVYYEKMLLNYPGSLFTIEARKRFNEI